MAERLNIPATKSNLIRLKEELSFAREGLDLLDQKKEALMGQISILSTKAHRLRQHLNRSLAEAYAFLDQALLFHGRLACERAALSNVLNERVQIRERSFMGVVLPLVKIEFSPARPAYGLQETGMAMDITGVIIRETLETIAELAELEVGLFRLVAEIRKTIRRLNALENIYLPLYQASVRHIQESLEEKEREALFQLKRLKGRKEAAYGPL